jgi:peptide/nickel transport system permease protein
MVRRVIGRLGPYVVVLWAALTVSFALPRLAPGEPLDYLLGYDAGLLSPADRARVLAQYGLDRPVPEQYVSYLVGIARGDLGTSVRSGRPVFDLVAGRLGWTLALAIPTVILATLIGVPLGAFAAWRRRRRSDVALTGAALLMTSVPAFWLGLVLLALFAVGLGWVPVIASLPITVSGPAAILEVSRRLALPVLTLTLGTAGWMLLTSRAAVEGTFGEAYLQLARANGIRERDILLRHALRNALLPIVTNAGLTLGTLIGGVVVIETVFSVPGIGSLMYTSVLARDYPTLQGVFLVTVMAVVGANLAADLIYSRLDPRIHPARATRVAGAPMTPARRAGPG